MSSDWRFRIDGEITTSTVDEARLALAQASVKKAHPPIVRLDSPGGDVMAAMELGRLLREWRAEVIGVQCASACVLVFAAGSKRRTVSGRILIHRPYFVHATSNPSQKETQASFSAVRTAVRNYLQEMNVSPALWDAMVAVSPSDARALDEQELIDYGLVETDPVEEEMIRQDRADILSISPPELLSRQMLGTANCGPEVEDTGTSSWTANNIRDDCLNYFEFGGKERDLPVFEYGSWWKNAIWFCSTDDTTAALAKADVNSDMTKIRKSVQQEYACVQSEVQSAVRRPPVRDYP